MEKPYSSLQHTHGIDFWMTHGNVQTQTSIDLYKNSADYLKVTWTIYVQSSDIKTVTLTFMPYSGSHLYLLSTLADIFDQTFMLHGKKHGLMALVMHSLLGINNLHLHTLSNTPLKTQEIKYG